MREGKLTVFCPSCAKNIRLHTILNRVFQGKTAHFVTNADEMEPVHGGKVLFAVALPADGINPEYAAMLGKIRRDPHFFDGSTGALLVDGGSELYTKALARELTFSANRSGCAFIGKPLVEATGSLDNFAVQARLRETDLAGAYACASADLVDRLLEFETRKALRPKLLALHASNRVTSNTLALWEGVRQRIEERVSVQEINLRTGTLVDCNGCEYRTCLHFGEKGGCFYGGVMVDEVYPAVREADGILWICPNYNDALSANLTACVNRLTALFRTTPFYDKALYGIIVSGYSGGDLVAQQLISALSMNKAFYLPPRFCLLETANDAGTAIRLPGIEQRLDEFADHIFDFN
jgi:hypothetical protein